MITAPPLLPAVRCRNVVREFGHGDARARVLHGIDIDVFMGEITLLVGPSGCGKTTLISILAGILVADEGEVEVLGTRLAQLDKTKATRFRGANIGLILQQFNLLPTLTVVENVSIPLLLQGHRQRSASARAITLLEELGLGHHAARFPLDLSMGQQQRVATARALIHDPRLVICDEPTAMLDAAAGLAVMQMLRKVARRPDRAVIIVTHDDRILPFADRIATMSDGLITAIEVVSNSNRKAA